MKTKNTKSRGVPISKIQIWNADDAFGMFVGYLITEPGKAHRPIAFVSYDDGRMADDLNKAFHLAQRLTFSDEWRTWKFPLQASHVTDLRAFGRLDSIEPFPAFVFSLRCSPAAEPDGSRPMEISGSTPLEPRPFCRFMLLQMQANEPKPGRLQ